MSGKMSGELVERLLDQGFVGDGCTARREALEPSRALAVGGEKSMDIGADHAAIARDRPFSRPIGKAGEGPRAVGAFGHPHMHLVAGERSTVRRRAGHGLEPLLGRQGGLDIEQAEAGRRSAWALDAIRVMHRAPEHLVATAQPEHHAAAAEMGGSTGTAILSRASGLAGRAPSSARASSAGRSRASGKKGTRPSPSQPVAPAILAMPSANSAGSPRNLLTRKPQMRRASSGSITALVPTRLAITPPLSMSPISTTGTWAARAKPMLAMSFARRFTSEALPAPSTSTMSASCFRWAKLSCTKAISSGLRR